MTSQKPSPEVFERAFRRWRTEILQRPTIGEYPVYDEHLYRWMMDDPVRTAAYRKAIGAAVRGKRVLDLGTGAQAFLAVMCAKAGASHVDALEVIPASAAAAREYVKALGLENIITVHCGTSFDVQVSPPADICVSEIIGMIGSAEGVQSSLRDAGRFLQAGGQMIPQKCITLFAPATQPSNYYTDADVEAVTRYYVDSIFDAVGHRFALTRLATFNFPAENLLASPHPFEILEFSATHADATTEMSGRTRTRFAASRTGLCNGFILWVHVHVDERNLINTWRGTSWAPVFLQTGAFPIECGDVIEVESTIDLGLNGINPDYGISGTLYRRKAAIHSFAIHSPHVGPALCNRHGAK
ncbi:MAG: hypothetical protein ACLQO1_14460 [Steroidobacteraceae bacterium]